MIKTHKFWALIGLSCATLNAFIDLSMTFTALPSLQRDLALNVVQLQWIMNAFLLFFCIFMTIMGFLGDRYGRKRILITGLIGFAIFSLVAGLATSSNMLIFARIMQGISAAALVPCSLGLVPSSFAKEELGKAFGIWTSITSIGIAIGPALAGIIVVYFSWRGVFLFHIPVALFSLLLCLITVPQDNPQNSKKLIIDWKGFILLSLGLISLVFGLTEGSVWGWTSLSIILFLVVGILALAVFYFIEKYVEDPIINFKLFSNKIFLPASLSQVAITVFNVVALFLMPIYLQNFRHFSPVFFGVLLSIVPGTVVVLSPFSGYYSDKIGVKQPILLGLLLLIIAAFILYATSLTTPITTIIISFILWGAGWAFIIPPSTTAAVSSLPAEHAGVASGLLWTIQNVSGTIGLSIGGAIFTFFTQHQLTQLLVKANIIFSELQNKLIYSSIADPEGAIHSIQVTSLKSKLLIILQHAFFSGVSIAIAYIGIVSFIILFLVIFLMKPRRVTVDCS